LTERNSEGASIAKKAGDSTDLHRERGRVGSIFWKISTKGGRGVKGKILRETGGRGAEQKTTK